MTKTLGIGKADDLVTFIALSSASSHFGRSFITIEYADFILNFSQSANQFLHDYFSSSTSAPMFTPASDTAEYNSFYQTHSFYKSLSYQISYW